MTYRSQDEVDTIEMDCIDEDPTQPIPEPTPTRRRHRHLALEPLPLTPLPVVPAPLVPLPELRDEPPTIDESTRHDRACTTVEYHVGAEIAEDSDLIPLPRRRKDSDAWHIDTRERTRPFRRSRRARRGRRRRR